MRVLKFSTYILAALITSELSNEANAAGIVAEECGGVEGQTKEGELNSTLSPALVSCTLASEAAPRFRPVSMALSTHASDLAQATSFSDLQGNWAESFIQALTARNIIQGFPDGSFRPDEPVTRAQFAAMIRQAFQKNPTQEVIEFVDVPAYYWAREAIQSAYQMGFLAGYPNRVFNPNQNIPRAQVLVALANGLDLSARPETTAALNTYFEDAAQIPDYARNSVAAATEKSIVVNYPTVKLLNPNQIATRADVAAFIYQALASSGAVPQLTADSVTQYIVGSQQTAATPSSANPTVTAPPAAEVEDLQSRLLALQGTRTGEFGNVFRGSPSISIANPSGFGADNNTLFVSASYQTSTREGENDDGSIGFGVGLGDARRLVGVEVSYTLASVTADYTEFGRGGFNVKVHRQLPRDFAVAVGYNGFLNIGDTDFEDSVYGVASKIFRTRDDITLPFSRVAVTAGVGNGQFGSADAIDDDDNSFNVFGGVAVRVIQPVSVIAEWTGQDLALGFSIVPFRNTSFVITPALRDVAGDGDGVRFVLGAGYSFQF